MKKLPKKRYDKIKKAFDESAKKVLGFDRYLKLKKLLLVMIFLGFSSYAFAQEINVELLANAIYKAENSKSHPYGIMQVYKHTTPRQACINSIKHRLKEWNGQGDFIVFLGLSYSPPDINPNWVRLVKYFYAKETNK